MSTIQATHAQKDLTQFLLNLNKRQLLVETLNKFLISFFALKMNFHQGFCSLFLNQDRRLIIVWHFRAVFLGKVHLWRIKFYVRVLGRNIFGLNKLKKLEICRSLFLVWKDWVLVHLCLGLGIYFCFWLIKRIK